MPELFQLLFWMAALSIVWLSAPPAVAYLKGYDATPWFCALGLIGVFALAFLPRMRHITKEDDREAWRAHAKRVGYRLSALGLMAYLNGLFAIILWKRLF